MSRARSLSLSTVLPVVLPVLALALSTSLPTSARAEAPTHELRKTEPKAVAGAKASASLTIAAKNGWHVNDEAPITVALASTDAGLTVAKPKLTRADLVESTKEAARFDIAFLSAEPGQKTITAEAKFVMCQETACKPVKETLAFNIEVAPAAAAPDASAKATSKTKSKKKQP
jgi:DsbC/DsbD-like thiol-disulfide interchange protein